MLLLAALAVVFLTLAALGSVCDRLGPEDPSYATPAGLVPARCADPRRAPDPAPPPPSAA
ncbi:MAG: hypothetical protein NVSMB12_02890 [Acidimicrobiales bacterium]